MRKAILALTMVVSVGVLTATAQAGSRPQSSTTSLPTTTITVSAAASLTDVFPVIAAAFRKRYPQVQVRFNFGGSNALVEQVRSGAPVDVLATASESTMASARSAGLTAAPLLFARNTMMIATPKGNPAGIRRLADLQDSGVLVAVCAPAVPCGVASREILAKNRVTVNPVTRELDVRAVLGKVIADQVDAGLVYVTDVRTAGDKVTGIAIPTKDNVFTDYPIAVVSDSRNPRAARAFVNYVRHSRSAQGILRAWGFSKPW